MNKEKEKEKEKVIIYGASTGGIRAYEHLKKSKKQEVVAFIDRSEKLHGSKIDGIKIFLPEEIMSIEYDKIIICSAWHNEIKKLLEEAFKIKKEKISIINSTIIKGSTVIGRDKQYQTCKNLLLGISEKFNKENIYYYADHGTLLGLIRDNDLIAWDNDIDIAINSEDFEKVQKSLTEWLDTQVESSHIGIEITHGLIEPIEKENEIIRSIKIFKYEETDKSYLADIHLKYEKNGKRYWQIGKVSLSIECTITKNTTTKEFYGKKISIPAKHEEYLNYLYGDWKTPNKNWTHADYCNQED